MSVEEEEIFDEPELLTPMRLWKEYRQRLEALPTEFPGRDEHLRWADFTIELKKTERRPKSPYILSPELLRVIRGLIVLETIDSVSCPFDDFEIWRVLVDEQKRRATRSGLDPQAAFTLCGPDSNFHNFDPADLGGEVHIPYEGACLADLFIIPHWRMDALVSTSPSGRRHALLLRQCRYILLQRDFGEIAEARRTAVSDWVLYESLRVDNRCDPLGHRTRGRSRE